MRHKYEPASEPLQIFEGFDRARVGLEVHDDGDLEGPVCREPHRRRPQPVPERETLHSRRARI